jgi:hypothetical protein
MIGGRVGPGAAAAQFPGQRLAGVVAVGQQRVVAKPLKSGWASSLLSECAVTTEASSRMHVTCSSVLSAMRMPGRVPWRAAAQARRRAALTPAVIRTSGRLPPAAISFSGRG